MMRVKGLLWAMAVVVLLGGCAAPQTQTSSKDYEALCSALDKEGKGYVGKEDFVTGTKDKKEAAKLFEMCDTNQDGKLSFDEYTRQQRLIHNLFELQPPPAVVPVR
jgi:hypothetical protein